MLRSHLRENHAVGISMISLKEINVIIIQYKMTTMFPDEYLLWLVTEAASQVRDSQDHGLRSHRILQSQQNPQEFLIIDEWESEPRELDYFFKEEIEGGSFWTSLTAGPDITWFHEVSQDEDAARSPFRPQKD